MLYPEIAQELLKMERVDQEMRSRNLKDPDQWDSNVDYKHTERMREIVNRIGWPTVSKVGNRAAHSAWLLVQHADHDVVFQQLCLYLMKESIESEVDQTDLAYLEDRTRVNAGRPQLFGTQFTKVNGEFVPRPIENPEKVDERRLSVGLDTLEEGIEQMKEKYGDEP